MSLFSIQAYAFAVGSERQNKSLTSLYILDRALVEARDPAGLTPVDATRALGKPDRLRATASGKAAFMGNAEEARKVLTEAGMLEAPVAVPDDSTQPLAYADRTTSEGFRPVERLVHIWREGRMFIHGRFPGEPDRMLGHADLPDNLRPHLPAFAPEEGFACAHDADVVSGWLASTANIARVDA